jgi:hypothetical protein
MFYSSAVIILPTETNFIDLPFRQTQYICPITTVWILAVSLKERQYSRLLPMQISIWRLLNIQFFSGIGRYKDV